MKVFESFWEGFRKELEGDYTIDDVFFAERIWKAALRWVKGNVPKTIWNEHDLDFIDKELGE